jgi:hypothetical protein
MNDAEARALARRVESLLESLDAVADPTARERAIAAVQAVVELYGEGLARMLGHIAGAGAAGLIDTVAGDEVVGNLLIIHGLHPLDAQTRARQTLETLMAAASHDARAELVGVENGIARVVLRSADGRASSIGRLRRTVEEALAGAVPDLDRIEVEETAAPALLQIGVRPSVAAMARASQDPRGHA